jgi:hypothetical protein
VGRLGRSAARFGPLARAEVLPNLLGPIVAERRASLIASGVTRSDCAQLRSS